MELFFLAFGALFSIMNPLGTVPVFATLTQQNNNNEKQQIALKTAINVLIILLISFFLGQYILTFFNISIISLKIAGGLIISSSGFALLTGKFSEHKGMKRQKIQNDIESRNEISLTPLAIPMIAGPGTISLLITYNQEYKNADQIITIIIAMIIAALSIFIILRSAHFIVNKLGASGINALSRIIGFIVIAIGVEFIISSITLILKQLI